MVVPVDTSPKLEIGDPSLVFEHQFLTLEDLGSYSTYFDISPDEKHFVMIQVQGEIDPVSRYNFILNWSQEVERRLKSSR